MPLVHLSLGSNLGDREKILGETRQALQAAFSPVRFSRVYETEPVDLKEQPWFLNQVAEVGTDLSPGILLEWVRVLETKMGRQRDVLKGPRTLDLDILLYDDRKVEQEGLTIPHPRLHLRRHVLEPLAELIPEVVLPGLGLTVREALRKLLDPAEVRLHPEG